MRRARALETEALSARYQGFGDGNLPFDPVVAGITVALVMFGIIMVYSVSYPRSQIYEYTGHESAFFVKRQALWAATGLAFMFGAAFFARSRVLRWITPFLLAATVLSLVLVLFFGVEVQGARRWFRFGPVSFQPSELAKLATVLFLAWYCAKRRQRITNVRGLKVPMAVVGLIALLVVVEPDLGTSLMIGAAALVTLAVAGARPRHLAFYAVLALGLVVVLIVAEPYRLNRFREWIWPGYQAQHCLIALGSGGVFGRGLGESREKFFYLPAATTDSIFAVIGEELGLIGTLGLAVLFLWLAERGLRIARRSPDYFLAVAAAGITLTIVLQGLINMAVATALLPTTGVPLPFISLGGSSLVFTLTAIGILLAISRRTQNREHVAQPAVRRPRYAPNPN
jgi:cell division protein FtsW